MAEIINLRQARKRRARADAQATAAANRLKHGRSLAEREVDDADAQRRDRALDGARLEPDDGA